MPGSTIAELQRRRSEFHHDRRIGVARRALDAIESLCDPKSWYYRLCSGEGMPLVRFDGRIDPSGVSEASQTETGLIVLKTPRSLSYFDALDIAKSYVEYAPHLNHAREIVTNGTRLREQDMLGIFAVSSFSPELDVPLLHTINDTPPARESLSTTSDKYVIDLTDTSPHEEMAFFTRTLLANYCKMKLASE